jgi:hypothetical protein
VVAHGREEEEEQVTKYLVAQTPGSGTWRHYLCGWHGDVPVWLPAREEALKLDEPTARQLVDRFDTRYRRVVQHLVEEVA